MILVSIEDHSNNDCLLVAVMTHGRVGGELLSSDHKYYHSEELLENFVGLKCKTLVGKPKLFFIQACRGSAIDSGVSLPERNIIEEDTVPQKGILIPNSADVLIMYSSSEGHGSYRSKDEGTWFIQTLCEELSTNSQEDLMKILEKVNKKIAYNCSGRTKRNFTKRKQMPSIVSTLTKGVFFSQSSHSDINVSFIFNTFVKSVSNVTINNHYYVGDVPNFRREYLDLIKNHKIFTLSHSN